MTRPLRFRGIRAASALLALAACSDAPDAPWLEFAGGGFILNYRLAEADYGFVARVLRPLPSGAMLEAEFEDPAGGAPIRLREAVRPGRLQYVFRTPPVRGVVAGRGYAVTLRLVGADGTAIASYSREFSSDVDQSVLPESAPVVGPGYQRAPPS